MADVPISELERSHLQSKKFAAYLVAEFTWKILLFFMVWRWADKRATVMIATIIVAGFIECGFILGQAALDRYVRVAAILKRNGNGTVPADPETPPETPPADPVPPANPEPPATPASGTTT